MPKASERRSLSQGRIALAGGILAVLIAAIAWGGWWIVTRDSSQPATAAAPAPSTTPTTTGVPSLVGSDPVVATYTFKSQSGNIRCGMGKFSGQLGAICQQISINYAPPLGVCPSAAGGVFVGVQPTGTYWPCVSRWPEPVDILAFDSPVTHAGVTCVVNYVTGVKCENEEGHGFTMEYDAGISTF